MEIENQITGVVENENLVTKIEKYNEKIEQQSKFQIIMAMAFGAEAMYIILGLLNNLPPFNISAMLLAMGLSGTSVVMSMLEEVKISQERKYFIQQQIEGMKFETNQEGKSR